MEVQAVPKPAKPSRSAWREEEDPAERWQYQALEELGEVRAARATRLDIIHITSHRGTCM